MKYLYAPWRSNYVKNIFKGKTEKTTEEECNFCQKINENDLTQHFIFRKFNYHMVMLNLFPYNAGHLLIVYLGHKSSLEQIGKEARIELIELTNQCINILQSVMKANGINVGTNLGKAAGAGIPSHLHTHVLPRWYGDTNFLPLLAQTKQISVDLKKIYAELKPYFETITLSTGKE